ncbi:MAG: thioredoxin [Bdellovibrionales bacterium RIFOXYD1_FULL_44_7]|nr:MAG: thioredoxin [Bdellovibrionales bacterium RIFOXYD1_FULL_44_7]
MASENVKATTDSSFETDVLRSDCLTLVDFWAEWCGPCRMLAPTLDALAKEFEGKVKILKINVDENPQIPTQYHVRGIPTVLMFQGGQIVDQLVGNQPKDAFADTIQKHLSTTPA